MITSEEIKRRLWNGANELRGSMDASRYKDYMLGLMFYKFLSDKTLEAFKVTAGLDLTSDRELQHEYEKAYAQYDHELEKMIHNVLGYYVSPEYTYQAWLDDIDNGEFEVDKVADSLNNFERTISITDETADFKGLFSGSTMDLSDTALGSDLNARNKNIKALILLFADLNMAKLQKGDVLGDAYEYLIGQFAMESGKKAGEFYTPRQVSEVMARIVTKSGPIGSIYDPTVGSGSLLLTVGKHLDEKAQKDLEYYGQEKNTATYNLTRMNLLLHGVRPEKMEIRNGDTLAEDWPEDPSRPNEGVQFDAVVMNPPYSLKNWNREGLKVSDPRFAMVGVLPPKSKGDYAFLLHGLFHLNTSGTMAIVLPHGVLFRGGAEGEIRKRLIEKNYIDTIIGMPAKLFTNTGIPVVIMILKKNRDLDEPLLIIDASENFEKAGKQNRLREKDIARITDAYTMRSEIAGFSHLATREEIIENEYNLNIPRYVDNIDQEIPHDVDAHLYGGIPQKNIDNLKILCAVAPEVLKDSLDPIRQGYVKLNKPIEQLKQDILNSETVVRKTNELEEKLHDYIDDYWNLLRQVDDPYNLKQISDSMLTDIKDLLETFNYIDVYDGYQIIAELWDTTLQHDLELIAVDDFHNLGRSREPNMVTKGSGKNKREEQEGWNGTLIPNELVAKNLYSDELEAIEDKEIQLSEVESDLEELFEAIVDEDSEENEYLYGILRMNKDDEPTGNYDKAAIKRELKKATKGSPEYEYLSKAKKLNDSESRLKNQIKKLKKQLDQDVQDRILELSDEEINDLVYEKWFSEAFDKLSALIKEPILNDLETLELLSDRYSETIDDIDEEIASLEKELKAMMSELVVTTDE